MGMYLCAKFEVSSVILTSFRQWAYSPPPQNEPLKSPPKLELNKCSELISKCKHANKYLLRNYKANN